MASLKRCDVCKKLSEEPNIGYIGRSFVLKRYKDTILTITVIGKDMCGGCIKTHIDGFTLHEFTSED